MKKLLIVGHSLRLEINRSIYYPLIESGWDITFLIADLPDGKGVQTEMQGPGNKCVLRANCAQLRFYRLPGLLQKIREVGPRVAIIENEPDSMISCSVGRAMHRTGGKAVCITNENDLQPIFGSFIRGRIKAGMRAFRTKLWCRFSRHCLDYVFAISQDGLEIMRHLGFSGRVSKMPLGFNESLFFPYSPEKRQACRDALRLTAPTIAYCGRIVPIKGVHILIAALSEIQDLDWQFLIDDFGDTLATSGEGSYPRKIKGMLEQNGLMPRVRYFHASHAEMPKIMNAADIIVLPSLWKEQYGRVAPEAMACGRVVLASDIGTLPELLAGNGVCIPPGDVEVLALELRKLLATPATRGSIGSAAAAHAGKNLGIKSQILIMDPVLRYLYSGTEV